MLPVGAPTRLGVKPLPWPRWLENSSALETALLREPCFGVGLCRDPLRAFPRIFAHFFFAVQPQASGRIFRISNRLQFVSAKPIFGAFLAEDPLRYAALADDEHPLRFMDGAHPLPYAEFLSLVCAPSFHCAALILALCSQCGHCGPVSRARLRSSWKCRSLDMVATPGSVAASTK